MSLSLSPGDRLGPYEIVAPLGAGGMGEVYRAKDPRLGREVAIKILPASFSNDPDRLRRFEQEARAAGVLNHPNITAVYDIGSQDGSPYVVSELLEGETLRSRLSVGALPVRKAIDYATQIARGLAAAHEKKIIHRDLKPENLFVTRDGRVKILDFGLAKLKQTETSEGRETESPTATVGTDPGVVMGTMGYISPEQVRGLPADQRSDIFSFGTILYEMLSGQRAFRGDTAADTITAILTKEPPDLSQTNKEIHPGLERLVRHCLEKNREERFESARDLAFDLEALSGLSGPAAVPEAVAISRRRSRLPLLVAAAALLVLGAAVGVVAGKRIWSRPPPTFHQLTFRRGNITSARFAPDGRTVLYTAGWEGSQPELFVNRLESPESRPFGLSGAEVLGISRSGEMAVSLQRHVVAAFTRSGTLARMSLSAGTAPREIVEDVQWADWAPNGMSLAVVRDVEGRNRLEFPIGKSLYETAGWISHPRVSPEGDRVAFVDHLLRGDDGGKIAVVDLSGEVRHLTDAFESAQGLAWSSGGEIWFTAAQTGGNRALWAVTLSGHSRNLVRGTAPLTIQDMAADGRVLMLQDTTRVGMLARIGGEEKERDLSWLDWSVAADLSPDGKTLLFFESGEGSGPGYSVYLRKTDRSSAVRLGEGGAGTLSPDGGWVLSLISPSSQPQIALFPTGAGEMRKLPRDGLTPQRPDWLPDGRHTLFTANEPGHGARVYVQDLTGGKPRALTPEGYRSFLRAISPDGKFVAASGPDRRLYLYPVSGGEPTALPGVTGLDIPLRWTIDGRSLYVYRRGELPARVYLLDVTTGHKQLWRELMPADSAGVVDVVVVCPTPDGRSYVYSYGRVLSNLYVVEGLS